MILGRRAPKDWSKIPAADAPDGEESNLIDPETLVPEVFAVATLMIAMSLGLIGVRVYHEMRKYRKLALENYFCIVAWLLLTGYTITGCTMALTFRHIWDIPASAFNESWLKKNAALSVLVSPATWCAKTAVLILYIRLFGTYTWFRHASIASIIFLGLFYWSTVAVYIVFSFPHGADEAWDIQLSINAQKGNTLGIVIGAVNVAADIFIFVLPLPIIYSLQLTRNRKAAYSAVFLTAAVGISCSCIALAYRVMSFAQENRDSTWFLTTSFICVITENYVTVMISCMPAIPWGVIFKNSSLQRFFSSVSRPRGEQSRSRRQVEDQKSPIPSNTKAYRLRSMNNLNDEEEGESEGEEEGSSPSTTTDDKPSTAKIVISNG